MNELAKKYLGTFVPTAMLTFVVDPRSKNTELHQMWVSELGYTEWRKVMITGPQDIADNVPASRYNDVLVGASDEYDEEI
jgi:hypothetical protein